MGIKHIFHSAKTDGVDATKVRPNNWNDDHEIDGDVDFDGHAVNNLEDEAYNPTAWDGNLSAPTKNALRDKIEALVLSGGGVTNFLALDDTVDDYTGFGGDGGSGFGPGSLGAFVLVNQAEDGLEFKYSTHQYVDIRDYGSFVSHDNITTQLQAALDDYATHRQKTIRIPWVGNQPTQPRYYLDTITFPSDGWTIEFDCVEIGLNATLALLGNCTLRGVRNSSGSSSFARGPGASPTIYANTNLSSAVTASNNTLIENVAIGGQGGHGLSLTSISNVTLRNCSFGSDDTPGVTGLKIESSFWIILEDLVCYAHGSGSTYAMEITTDGNWGPNCSLVTGRNIKPINNGILFRSEFGPEGVGAILLIDVCSENQVAGTSLLTFDSSPGSGVNAIKVVNPVLADPATPAYVVKNIGTNTSGITIEGLYNTGALFDPASTAIKDFVQDQTLPGITTYGMNAVHAIQVGSHYLSSWQLRTPTSIDARLLTAPVGLPWVVGTPLAVVQNPASWTPNGGGVITAGKLAPDGSTMAGRVAGGDGALCYDAFHTLAVGDWVIMGVWARRTTVGGLLSDVYAGPGFVTGDGTFRVNGGAFPQSMTFGFLEYHIPDDGWVWLCQAYQVTATAGGSIEIKMGLNSGDYFNPCATLIPASAGIDDAWAIKLARMLRGGWSSNAPAGNVSILDHQQLWSGKGMAIVDGVTAPSTVAGFAQIYVDTADGDLKVKFGDGTIKTIVVDT